jgi:hypothetical protein
MDQITRIPTLTTATEWLTVPIIIVSVVLALLSVTLMFMRAATDTGDGSGKRQPPYIDSVLIISAGGVLALALATWWLR